MDRRERTADREEQLSMAIERYLSMFWGALPGIIKSFNEDELTCTVQPAMKGRVLNKDGTYAEIDLPLLLDCPVIFPGGGGCTLTFPLKDTNEGLVVFASRCIDAWWQHGTVSLPPEFRMHDLSDGFIIPGLRSLPRKITAAASAQFRTDDGSVFVQVDGDGVKIKGPTTMQGDVVIQGNLTVTGIITGTGSTKGPL